MTGRIAFQGEPGAYSHQACHETRPDMEALPCRTFEDAFQAVESGKAELAMELLYSAEIDQMTVPTYIDQGLVWLADQLKRKEDGIAGKSPVEPEGIDAEGSEAKEAA